MLFSPVLDNIIKNCNNEKEVDYQIRKVYELSLIRGFNKKVYKTKFMDIVLEISNENDICNVYYKDKKIINKLPVYELDYYCRFEVDFNTLGILYIIHNIIETILCCITFITLYKACSDVIYSIKLLQMIIINLMYWIISRTIQKTGFLYRWKIK